MLASHFTLTILNVFFHKSSVLYKRADITDELAALTISYPTLPANHYNLLANLIYSNRVALFLMEVAECFQASGDRM